MRCIST